ncbi:LPXTG cell wall anchor domain-containing protein [Lactococcus nasutitermitis]|uniref:LPXTG cell wall anchor domain-containing protein n=1 Tax=Lactococcus nasutitermitis TaxID=1652957 RepID=A0ABV9JCD4_9LACT|nr:LPXTG cell wall anchor domain-containing protein [Lactococcus nasutitermitis]
MRKILVAVLLLFIVGHLPRADAATVSARPVTDTATITFIANPNLPKPSAPGLPNGNPIKTETPKGTLPKTGETQNFTIPTGIGMLFVALLLYLKLFKEKSYKNK